MALSEGILKFNFFAWFMETSGNVDLTTSQIEEETSPELGLPGAPGNYCFVRGLSAQGPHMLVWRWAGCSGTRAATAQERAGAAPAFSPRRVSMDPSQQSWHRVSIRNLKTPSPLSRPRPLLWELPKKLKLPLSACFRGKHISGQSTWTRPEGSGCLC